MAKINTVDFQTSVAGAPIDDLTHLQSAGPRGPALLQDFVLLEQLQIMNRERIPERVVHARGVTAKGTLKVTGHLAGLTVADFLQEEGRSFPVTVRFSPVIHGRHSPEYLRDVRGFALKIYTNEGNYDIVGNHTSVFFVREGIRFVDAIRSMKPNPKTDIQEWWRIWDFFSHYPESIHGFTWLLDDIGIPRSVRHMNGFSINTFKLVNKEGKETFFRWHFRTRQGEEGMLEQEALLQHFSFHTIDLVQSIRKGIIPKWDLEIQLLEPDKLPDDFDPLDATKEWPVERFPYRKVGEFELNENVDAFFPENENVAFSPARLVPGIAPSNDKLLQARLFAYMDNQVHRLGVNFSMLNINAPKCPFRDNHFDGQMNVRPESRGNQEINYFPSKLGPVKEAPRAPPESEVVEGRKVREDPPNYKSVDEFRQAGNRFRSFDEARKKRFADRVSLSLSGPSTTQEVRDIWVGYWTKADQSLGNMIRVNLDLLLKDTASMTENEIKHHAQLNELKVYFTKTGPAIV